MSASPLLLSTTSTQALLHTDTETPHIMAGHPPPNTRLPNFSEQQELTTLIDEVWKGGITDH